MGWPVVISEVATLCPTGISLDVMSSSSEIFVFSGIVTFAVTTLSDPCRRIVSIVLEDIVASPPPLSHAGVTHYWETMDSAIHS